MPDINPPTVTDVNKTSLTLRWNGPPPELTGSLQRNITQYAVTFSPQDSRESQAMFVPAEAGALYVATELQPGTKYDIKVDVVINTATKGQGELTYDIGIALLTITTGENTQFHHINNNYLKTRQ